MALELKAIQGELQKRGLDGWLLYDFRHSDPIAYRILGLPAGMITRRWYYFIPAKGEPGKLVHKIESKRLDTLPGAKQEYAAWTELREKLSALMGPAKKIAMQYSPLNNIPYVALVDAGTIELVRSLGREVVTSADLVQRFEARWSTEQHKMHLAARDAIDEIMPGTFQRIAAHLGDGKAVSEYDMQQWVMEQFAAKGLVTDDPPVVAVNAHSADPHYEPKSSGSSPIRPGDWVLVDMWAKLDKPGATYYDITWVGYAGEKVPAKHQEVFGVVREARDAAVKFIGEAIGQGRTIRGFEVDDVTRDVIRKAGYGDYFLHRTGHSLGEEVHSTGANMDNLETHDEREIIPGICFSIEPGIYLPEFGVRLEINIFVKEGEAGPTGAVQRDIVLLH